MKFPHSKGKTTNRNKMKQWFFTFPTSGQITKQNFGDSVMRFDPLYYKCSLEHHESGEPHLHLLMQCKNSFSKAFILKHFKKTFPEEYKRIDADPVRSIEKSMVYLDKEDKDPLTYGEFQKPRNPKLNWYNKLAVEFGYCNLADLATNYKTDQINKQKNIDLILKTYYEHLQHFEEIQIPWEITNKIKNLQTKPINLIPIDDIAFLLKKMQIKL